MARPKVGIIMGSDSDLPVMQEAADVLEEFGVPYELTIVSAHRTPKRMFAYAEGADSKGLEVIIAGAGGAAHLPGMIASACPLPVIGVPVRSSNSIDGWDSVLSILQMPGGVPVATVALNGARNAGLLAVQILSVGDRQLRSRFIDYKAQLAESVMTKVRQLAERDSIIAAKAFEIRRETGVLSLQLPGQGGGIRDRKLAGVVLADGGRGDPGGGLDGPQEREMAFQHGLPRAAIRQHQDLVG